MSKMKAKTIHRIEPRELQKRAGAVASLLSALANDRRLLILCKLVEDGEATGADKGCARSFPVKLENGRIYLDMGVAAPA